MAALIECNELSKSYQRVKAIDSLSLSIEAGEPVALVGPNGAGKTTLFSLIAGFLKKNSGDLKIMGYEPQSNELKGQIGILPQDSPFLKNVAIDSQLQLFARLQGMSRKDSILETERVLSDFAVLDLKDRKPEQLSYGQRKRIALAQALVGKPKLALLDEPTSGLDPIAANDVRQLIRRNQNETTFFISSHNLDELENLCQTIVLIDKGQLVISSTLAELTGQDKHLSFLLNSAASDSVLGKLQALPNISEAKTDPGQKNRLLLQFESDNPDEIQSQVLKILQAEDLGVLEFSRGRNLEDRILRLMHGQD